MLLGELLSGCVQGPGRSIPLDGLISETIGRSGVIVSQEPWGTERPPLFQARWNDVTPGTLLRLVSPETGRMALVQVVASAPHPTVERAVWDRLGTNQGLRVDRIEGQIGFVEIYPLDFHGQPTASGELRNLQSLIAGHRYLPFGSIVRVRALRSGRTVLVRVNDRAGFRGEAILLSPAAAERLGIEGGEPVRLEFLTTLPTGAAH
ncbi:MAG: hypothetical protein KatS3mg115_0984 [Candidatus Poribacteria bacterium]|nr:MAG: hypothetical protein KatS3mg115_0984 [Candidatus Poribacteria bacterium]